MSQAEIAGGKVTLPNELPSKGHCLRDFTLKAASSGHPVHLSDYRGRANLVLIVEDGRPDTAMLTSDATRHYEEIKNQEAEILAIVAPLREDAESPQKQSKVPYPMLIDESGSIHRQLGAVDSEGHDVAAVYVTDRFGEVFGAYRKAAGQALPDIGDILRWLEFVNAQCPECEPPEWPV